MYNLDGKIGGDAMLSERGELYARKLPEIVRDSVGVSYSFISHVHHANRLRTTDR